VPSFVYDALSPSFERHRPLPQEAAEAIRAAILGAAAAAAQRPRLLDLGAGTGRIGRPFAAAGDDYVGIDLSFGMLREFKRRCGERRGRTPCLVQSDGQLLPFRDATFDAVILIQVFGGMRGWRHVLAEARRVSRPAGVLITGRTVAPADGIDAVMKQGLAQILDEMNVRRDETNAWNDAQRWLESTARTCQHEVAAAWPAERTPRSFLERHRTGARFSLLPESVRVEALDRLGSWAAANFGSLDTMFSEQHDFELQVYTFWER